MVTACCERAWRYEDQDRGHEDQSAYDRPAAGGHSRVRRPQKRQATTQVPGVACEDDGHQRDEAQQAQWGPPWGLNDAYDAKEAADQDEGLLPGRPGAEVGEPTRHRPRPGGLTLGGMRRTRASRIQRGRDRVWQRLPGWT